MEKFNELKEVVNASVHMASAAATDKQSNGADITVKTEINQQQMVCHFCDMFTYSWPNLLSLPDTFGS